MNVSLDVVGWERVTRDAQLWQGPGYLYGLVLLASATGGDVTLYDSAGGATGRQIARFEGIADESRPIMFPLPLPLSEGLYVDIGSNVTEVLILWAPR